METIAIGEEIEVIVRRINGNRVTLAIRAPYNVRIVRGELLGKAPTLKAPEVEHA